MYFISGKMGEIQCIVSYIENCQNLFSDNILNEPPWVMTFKYEIL